MKLSTKIVSSFLLVTFIMGGFGFYMFNNVSSKLVEKQNEINKITALSEAVLDFNVENFHTQLEVWEYAYEPTEKRLNAFYKHEVVFDKLFADLVVTAGASDLSQADRANLEDLKVQITAVKASWVVLVEATEAVATGTVDAGEYDYLTYPMFDPLTVDPAEESVRNAMFYLEDVFDDSQFNKKVDTFVISQADGLHLKIQEMADLRTALGRQFAIAFVLVTTLAIGLAVVLTNMIATPIKQLTVAATKLGSGDVDVEIPDIRTNDEIKDLADTMLIVTDVLKLLKREEASGAA